MEKNNNGTSSIIADDSKGDPPNKKLRMNSNEAFAISRGESKVVVKQEPQEAVQSKNANCKRKHEKIDATSDEKQDSDKDDNKSMEVSTENIENASEPTKDSLTKKSPVLEDSNKNECTDQTVNKPSNSDNAEVEKRIKWGCGRHFSDQGDQENAENEEPSDLSTERFEDTATTPDPASPPVIRDKCTYGSQCYRRSAEHRARFRHPGDPDYDIPDTRQECPYGVNCYRKNPQHKRDMKHTARRQVRPHTPLRPRTPSATSDNDYSTDEESVDEDDLYEPSIFSETSEEYRSDIDDKSDVTGVSDDNDK